MAATMLVAAIIAGAYGVLIIMHVVSIRGEGPASTRDHPRVAQWLAASGERRHGREESDAVLRRMAEVLDREGYQRAMADIAAQDAIEHPLRVPTSQP
jgi:hypothetical protein